MGTCYSVIMMDEFDWDYKGTNKEKKLAEFEAEFKELRWAPDRVAEWPNFVVYDLDKTYPLMDAYLKLFKKYSDKAWYYPDNAMYDLQTLE